VLDRVRKRSHSLPRALRGSRGVAADPLVAWDIVQWNVCAAVLGTAQRRAGQRPLWWFVVVLAWDLPRQTLSPRESNDHVALMAD